MPEHDVQEGWCSCGAFHDKKTPPVDMNVKPPATENPPPRTIEYYEQNISEAARELGRKGGRKGGLARAKKLSPERLSEIARKAAMARWKPGESQNH